MLVVWLDWKGKTMRKRTKKVFTDYNDYKDRPFGLKWGTAFALAELTQMIDKNKTQALKVNEEFPIMDRKDQDQILQLAFLKSKLVSVQLDHRDENGHLFDSIEGPFVGMADQDYLYINDHALAWDSIRNIRIID